MDRVIVTSPFCGILYMQVCAIADATDEEILEVCNTKNPSGTTMGWANVIRENREVGTMDNPKKKVNLAPVQCKDYPDRKHFIAVC